MTGERQFAAQLARGMCTAGVFRGWISPNCSRPPQKRREDDDITRGRKSRRDANSFASSCSDLLTSKEIVEKGGAEGRIRKQKVQQVEPRGRWRGVERKRGTNIVLGGPRAGLNIQSCRSQEEKDPVSARKRLNRMRSGGWWGSYERGEVPAGGQKGGANLLVGSK